MGFKVFGGVALFRDPPLPVPLDALFMAHVLEVGELIKTLFDGVDIYFRFGVMGV